MSKIAVIFPSRGLCFSKTAAELLTALKGKEYKIFFSHRKPLPECFNEPIERALVHKPDYIWIVEDDMIIRPDTLDRLLELDVAVAVADYPITKAGRGSVFKDADGKILFAGTGCMLIKADVFKEFQRPYFRTDTKWNVKNYGDHIKFFSKPNNTDDGYGLHDITFCFELLSENIPIHCITKPLGQRKLKALGKAGSNNGAHDIEEWKKIRPNKRLKEIQSYPVEKTGKLVEVVVNGKILNVTKEHGDKLVAAGGHYPPKTASTIVWGKYEDDYELEEK